MTREDTGCGAPRPEHLRITREVDVCVHVDEEFLGSGHLEIEEECTGTGERVNTEGSTRGNQFIYAHADSRAMQAVLKGDTISFEHRGLSNPICKWPRQFLPNYYLLKNRYTQNRNVLLSLSSRLMIHVAGGHSDSSHPRPRPSHGHRAEVGR